jgi:hypothetical protein
VVILCVLELFSRLFCRFGPGVKNAIIGTPGGFASVVFFLFYEDNNSLFSESLVSLKSL